MKMMKLLRAGLVGLLLVHCDATIIGNPVQVGLDIEGSRSPLQNRLHTRGQSSFAATFSRATVVLSRIRFRPLEACQGGSPEGDIEFEGPFVVDLLSHTAKPSIETLSLPAGLYCRVELRLDRLDEDEKPQGIDASDAILDNSIRFEGEDKDGRPFVATLDDNEEFKIENEDDGFFLGEAGNELFFIVFDLTAWIENVDLASAVDSGGIVYIDKDNNETLRSTIRSNIKLSARLYRDQNGDGDLSSDEKTADDVLANGH